MSPHNHALHDSRETSDENGRVPPSDADLVVQEYLVEYRARRTLGDTNLSNYGALRCMISLVHGVMGHGRSRYPVIANDLAAYIEGVSGIVIPTPT